MLKIIGNWFHAVEPARAYRRSEYVILFLILLAGAVVRFWGLGNVGLHGDEETMAMPALAILETGQPYLPSGMYYSRALLNIYMMSGAVWLFGESEWAFRFPSAVVGSLTGLAAFFMGRRFLSPNYNLAFVATLTFLPGMIVVSQTARMYVFFVTALIWFGACLFRWERDERLSSLAIALLVWAIALHFQSLAIFAAPLFLFPGISKASWKLVIQGTFAFLVGGFLFHRYQLWIGGKYPDSSERVTLPETGLDQSSIEVLIAGPSWLPALVVFGAAALILAMLLYAARRGDWSRAVPAVLLGLGLLSLALLHYHIGVVLLLAGTVAWMRSKDLPRAWPIGVFVLAGAITAAYLLYLHSTGLYPGRQLIGALIGTPSVWPIIRFLEYSPFAAVVYGGVIAFALLRLARGRSLPVHFMFFVMSVWIPLLLIGYLRSYIPPRYAQGQLGFFLLCVFAGVSFLIREQRWTSAVKGPTGKQWVLPVVISIALINPVALSRVINPDYGEYPDHKGAAQYIQSLDLGPEAILIAEDVLQQTYYLGEVDYWLRPIDDAASFSLATPEGPVDQYTGTRVLGSGADLEEVLDSNPEKDVYIIGSGENFSDGKRGLRGRGIAEVLDSKKLEVVYEGRDGKTAVWKRR